MFSRVETGDWSRFEKVEPWWQETKISILTMSMRVLSRPRSYLPLPTLALLSPGYGLPNGRSYCQSRVSSERNASTSSSTSSLFSQHISCASKAHGLRRTSLRNPRGVRSMASVTDASSEVAETQEEERAFWEKLIDHQKTAARLPHLEEARLVVDVALSGILSTNSQKYEGYPTASLVDFAADEQGRPILAISTLSQHTRDLEANPRCSLLVPKDLQDKSDTTITLIGDALRVSSEEEAQVRASYLKKLPNAFWVDFGDFRLLRLEPKGVRYVTGIATGAAAVGNYSGNEYKATELDSIAQFTGPVAGHMNRDHADQTKQIVENVVGIQVDKAKILSLDRMGFTVEALRKGGGLHKIRVPFPRPAADRKDVKTLIVQMLTEATAAPLSQKEGKTD